MKHLLLVVLCVCGLHGQTHASQLEEEERVAGWVFVGNEEANLGILTFSQAESRVQSPARGLVRTPPPSPSEQKDEKIFIFDDPAYDPEAANTELITVEQNEAGDSQVVENKKKGNVVYQQPKELDLVKMVRDLELQKKDKQKEEQLVQCLQKEYLEQVGSYIAKEVKQSASSVFNYAMNNDPEEAAIQLVGWVIKKTQDLFYPEK